MYQISDAFRKAISTGYKAVFQCSILSGGQTVLSNLAISDGSITVDRNSAQRRKVALTATITDLSLIPSGDSSSLAPFGNEIQVFASWIDPSTGNLYIKSNGLPELIPMGVFPMTTVEMEDTGTNLTMTIDGYDRSWSVAQRKFKTPYNVPAGTAPEVAIQNILNAQYPGLPALNMTPTGFSLPVANFKEGDDPWAACLTLADAGGCELAFDVNGIPAGKPIPNPSNLPVVWSYFVDGTGDSAPQTITRKLTREGVSNDFIVSGTGSQNTPTGSGSTTGPVRAESSDSSAQFGINSNFGDIPTFVTSSLVTSTSAAQAASSNALMVSLGLVESFVVNSSPAPMFDIDDVLALSDSRLQVNCNMVTDAATLTLRHDGQTQLTGRRVY